MSSFSRSAASGKFAGLAEQRRAQRLPAAIVRDPEQVVVAQAEQRALQHRGEREIVLRQQQRIGQRDQVHHRDMIEQHHAVGAGDLNTRRLERADDRLE